MSQVTSHILDTAKGTPAQGINIILYLGGNDEWHEIARGITNADGRLQVLLEQDGTLEQNIYKLRFETKDYFDQHHGSTFYPYIEIVFEISDNRHYHIPLLLSPFGYTTYRGS